MVEINLRSRSDDNHSSRMCYVVRWTWDQIDGCDLIRDDRTIDKC
jgi:hypothetical protein